jgi:hypothetical protein
MMVTTQTSGKDDERSSNCEYLTLAFSPVNAPLRSRWRNNGLSADFLGDYVITFLPDKGGLSVVENRQAEIKHAVTYIANELLENAMKYHEREVDIPIGIHLELSSDHITVSVSNSIGTGQAQRYKEFVDYLLAGDAGDLLLKQQEASALASESSISCVGLLTMISDYDAELSWRFDPHPLQSQIMTVTTSAVLPLKNIPGAAA